MTDEVPLDVLYDLTQVSDVALSPDGSRVAMVVTEFDDEADERRSSLFVAPTDGSRPPHRLTRMANARAPAWSPDGTKLGFLAAREQDMELTVESTGNEDGDDSGSTNSNGPRTQLWTFDLRRGGDARQITDRSEGVKEFDWGPEGDRVVVSSRDPTSEEADYLETRRKEGGPVEIERLHHKQNGYGWLDSVTTYLFVVDVDTRQERRLDDAYGNGAYEPVVGTYPVWGNSGRIAFLSNRTENPDDSAVMDVYTIRPDGTGLERISDGEHLVISTKWHPETGQLAFVAADPYNACVPSGVYLTDDGGYRCLTPNFDRRFTGALRWERDDSLLATVADEGNTRVVRVHVDDSPTERVFGQQGRYRAIQGFDLRGGVVAVVLTHPSDGTDAYAVSVDDIDGRRETTDDSLRRLSTTNDDVLDEYPMPECERITIDSGGYEVEGMVYFPQEFDRDDPEPRPLVVSIHGGPLDYDKPEFDFEYVAWTSRGYIVFCPNYRGSASYGREFAEELRGAWGTAEVEDIVEGVESLVERGWVDPDRVFGSGTSYGAIAQGYLATQTDLFTAAAPEQGIYDLRADFGTSDSHISVENEFGLPWENPDQFEASSPITDVDEIDTPLLVMANGEDHRCPLFQSEQLYVSVKKQGVDSKLVVYPGEHHNVSDPSLLTHRLEQLTSWFEQHDPAEGAE